jgi:hypothetical protein
MSQFTWPGSLRILSRAAESHSTDSNSRYTSSYKCIQFRVRSQSNRTISPSSSGGTIDLGLSPGDTCGYKDGLPTATDPQEYGNRKYSSTTRKYDRSMFGEGALNFSIMFSTPRNVKGCREGKAGWIAHSTTVERDEMWNLWIFFVCPMYRNIIMLFVDNVDWITYIIKLSYRL